ncbi:MAG: hypothetical protein DWQ01_22745 [Planctomycetota bacterium]|nr:MAG: hypothetical protein DWQ01_22745 [Planctomycetota bacterium]
MPARRRTLVLWLLLGLSLALLPGCASKDAWVDNEVGRDYRFTFADGSWLKKPATLQGKLTLDTGEEYWVQLTAMPGEMAATAAKRWASLLNKKRARMAESSSNSIVIHRVQRLVLLSPMAGLKTRDLGPSERTGPR